MKTVSKVILLLALFLPPVSAQEENTEHTLRMVDGAKSPAATIDDFSWLKGYWVGEGFGGVGDEMWSAPMANVMLGTFRLVTNEKTSFSEILMLTVDESGASMKIKHFDENLKGWEEKDESMEFKLVKLEGTTAWFEGLTYQLDEKGVLTVYVSMEKGEEAKREGKFVFKRKSLE